MTAYLLILVAILSRVAPLSHHAWWNFTAVGGSLLFFGARRPLKQRLRYAFIKTYKPVLDDVSYRSFVSMEEYRRWCEENLPDWLGYGRV